MPANVEHLDPFKQDDYVAIQHVERYRFACAQLLPGDRVIDVASGAGYGTALLEACGCLVVGVDYDAELLGASRRRWPRLRFLAADARHLPIAAGQFDAAVSFETIEHLPAGEGLLAEIARLLRPGGKLICSTPNVAYTSHPPYHLKEYRPEEFFNLVEACLGSVTRLGQYFRLQDRLKDLFRWNLLRPLASFLKARGRKPGIPKLSGHRRVITTAERPDAHSPPDLDALADLFDRRPNRPYRVVPYRGSARLRIMIAMAEKRVQR